MSKLELRIFIKAPKKLELSEDTVLEVMKPLYSIDESVHHWYLSYLSHQLEHQHMTKSMMDPCVLIRRGGTKLRGLVLLQVDDSLAFDDLSYCMTKNWRPLYLIANHERALRQTNQPSMA